MKATVLSLPHIPKKTLGLCAENAPLEVLFLLGVCHPQNIKSPAIARLLILQSCEWPPYLGCSYQSRLTAGQSK